MSKYVGFRFVESQLNASRKKYFHGIASRPSFTPCEMWKEKVMHLYGFWPVVTILVR